MCEIVTADVLLHEVPIPFGKQNASRLHILSLAGYLESPTFSDAAAPWTRYSWETPSIAVLD